MLHRRNSASSGDAVEAEAAARAHRAMIEKAQAKERQAQEKTSDETPNIEWGKSGVAGLLDEACTDADLRDAIISSAGTLKYQIKIVENISANMKVIEVGGVCLEEKKAEEAKKRGSSSSTLSAAASLVHGVSASKKQRK